MPLTRDTEYKTHTHTHTHSLSLSQVLYWNRNLADPNTNDCSSHSPFFYDPN
ncbi:unnamed protein product [Musa acuminata subsp. burmannicoides]